MPGTQGFQSPRARVAAISADLIVSVLGQSMAWARELGLSAGPGWEAGTRLSLSWPMVIFADTIFIGQDFNFSFSHVDLQRQRLSALSPRPPVPLKRGRELMLSLSYSVSREPAIHILAGHHVGFLGALPQGRVTRPQQCGVQRFLLLECLVEGHSYAF